MVVHFAGRKEPADQLVAAIKQAGGDAFAIQADVRKSSEVKNLFEKAIAQYGRIDVVVNNAGIMLTKPIVNFSDEEFANQVDVNLTGAFYVLREAMTIVADNSSIIDISTSINRIPIPTYGHYGAIRVNAISPVVVVETPVTDFTEEQFDRVFGVNTKGSYFTLQQAAKHVSDNGRILYVASSTTSFPVVGMAVYGGSKTTPRYLVDILSKEIGRRGVTVNSIIPFAVDHAGIFADPTSHPELRKQLLDSCPMGRLAEVEDVANIAEFFASDLSSFVSGQHLLVNGGATN